MNAKPGQPELLAPCGNRESMRAAVANGADAVYFGLEDFNARRGAENFTLADLGEVMSYLHSRNVRGYVALNTLIFSRELPRAAEFVVGVATAGADAVIVQDPGMARLIRQITPTLPIHASTQMTQTHAAGLELLAALGVSRVILARELSLDMIRAIAKTPAVAEGKIGLEVFVHGAMCISYSGQCLASEGLLGRSANRGQCGQVCRLPCRLVVDGNVLDLSPRQYPLSPRDLAAYELACELCGIGVCGLKIEGRLKNSAYVAAVTRIYRDAIDFACVAGKMPATRSYQLTPQQRLHLEHTFSRGLTHGYLSDARGADLVEGEFPASRGIYLGHVIGVRGQYVLLETDKPHDTPPTQAGDGLVFDSGGQGPQIGGRVFAVELYEDRRQGRRPRAPRQFVLTFDRQLDLSTVRGGGEVWKTDDPKVRQQIESSFSRDEIVRRVLITAEVRAAIGGPLTVALSDGLDRVEVSWPGPLQQAGLHPLTADLLRQQLGRLGQTPFELSQLTLLGPGGETGELPVMAPKSVLNDLRRQAVDALLALRAKRAGHAIADPEALVSLRAKIARPAPAPAAPQLRVLVRDLDQLRAVLEWTAPSGPAPLAAVYCEFQRISDYAQSADLARGGNVSAGVALPRIIRPGEEKTLDKVLKHAAGPVLVRNLAELDILRRRDAHAELVGDHSLNATNELAVDYLLGLGLSRLTPGYDLSWPQLEAMLPYCPREKLEIALHHHLPMFHTQHCLAAANIESAGGTDFPACGPIAQPGKAVPQKAVLRNASCSRPCRSHRIELQDRNGERHPLLCDVLCRNTIYNSHAQTAAQFFAAMRQAGLDHFRLELLRETRREAQSLLELYAGLLSGEDCQAVWRRLKDRQAVTRGTWNEKRPAVNYTDDE